MSKSKIPAVELGYVEETDSWRLDSQFFPSKVGGLPAWLTPKCLPTMETVSCGICNEPCMFLLQVYAPWDDVRASAFHRTLFVFVCRNPDCCVENKGGNFVILRCQLPRENEFYPNEPLIVDENEDGSANFVTFEKRLHELNGGQVCNLCFCHAEKQCAQCKLVHYCCRSHQEIDWKLGNHKSLCGKSAESTIRPPNPLTFPEFELVTEKEKYVEKKKQERPESERLRDYEQFLAQQMNNNSDAAQMTKDNLTELEPMAKGADKDFKQFRRRLEQNPEQVLRYQRRGQPLLVNTARIPQPNQIPRCERCGAERVFEFQIMPHLLSHLGVDCVGKSIDWATVVFFVCNESCDIPNFGYAREFIWKQDYTD